MKRSDFDRLIDRYLAGKATEQERQKIEAWLRITKTERTTDLELSDEIEQRLFQRITDPEEDVADVMALYPRKPLLKRVLSKQWVQIAASVIVMLSISLTAWNVWDNSKPTDVITSDTREKLILNDGTLVWLQPGSEFSYYQDDDGIRRAELNGEALFEVAKVPNSTFTIVCGDISVNVMGTSFNLKTASDEIELQVLTGKVRLLSKQDVSGVNVVFNEKVVYSSSGHVKRAGLDEADVSEITADTQYAMTFDDAAMEEVIGKIERKFDVGIIVADRHLLRCHVTVDLTDNSLNNTFAMLTDLLNISYRIDGDTVVLSGSGCK
jgi:ferric-dicitrate binding protein FerR (iron transport regulator)